MSRLIILAEEESMKAFLDPILPRLLPASWTFTVIPHEGKSDLERSIPRKLKAWRESDVQFIILRDQDSASCTVVKSRLSDLCRPSGRTAWKVRIVCRELESWVLGDPHAIDAAFQSRLSASRAARLRGEPDAVVNPIQLIREHVPTYQKVGGAAQVAAHLDPARNRSKSFQVFVRTVRQMTEAGH